MRIGRRGFRFRLNKDEGSGYWRFISSSMPYVLLKLLSLRWALLFSRLISFSMSVFLSIQGLFSFASNWWFLLFLRRGSSARTFCLIDYSVAVSECRRRCLLGTLTKSIQRVLLSFVASMIMDETLSPNLIWLSFLYLFLLVRRCLIKTCSQFILLLKECKPSSIRLEQRALHGGDDGEFSSSILLIPSSTKAGPWSVCRRSPWWDRWNGLWKIDTTSMSIVLYSQAVFVGFVY